MNGEFSAVSDASNLTKLEANLAQPSRAFGVLGTPGFIAYIGLLDIGQPKARDTEAGLHCF